MNIMKLIISILVSALWIQIGHAEGVSRHSFIIGKNYGGVNRSVLKYAVSDAKSFHKVLKDYGGVEEVNGNLLLGPSISEIYRKLDILRNKLKSVKSKSKSELFFYYSGHSDEEGLLIGNSKLYYKDLKRKVDDLNADVRVVILDSCSSGSFTSLKGGLKRAPFLQNNTSSLHGHVFLTSSSSDEAAQESDKIKASFFTHYLVSGLRGAADKSKDGRVTINEAYKYAYNETLEKTSKTINGPQHPSYNMKLVGTGELVLTDLRRPSSKIILSEVIQGRVFIKDSKGNPVAEINKKNNGVSEIALSPGRYHIVLNNNKKVYELELKIRAKEQKLIVLKNMSETKIAYNATRGNVNYVRVPLDVTITPSLSSYTNEVKQSTLHNFSLSLLYNRFESLEGYALALGALNIDNDMTGIQQGVFFNRVGGNARGVQATVGVNEISGGLDGVQLSAIYNSVDEVGTGLQASLISNHANEFLGLQVSGVSNVVRRDSGGIQLSAISNYSKSSFKGIQLAGISNVNLEKYVGMQMSIASNYSGQDMKGVQISGISNSSLKSMRGGQYSVISNYVGEDLKGYQLSFISNNVKSKLSGLQIGLLNYAKDVRGLQVGLINYSENLRGLSIAPITIVKNGTYRLAMTYDDKRFVQISLEMGTNSSYSKIGVASRSGGSFWRKYIFGIGLNYPVVNNLMFNSELVFNAVTDVSTINKSSSRSLYTTGVNVGFKYPLYSKMSVKIGTSYDFILSESNKISVAKFRDIYHGRKKWIGTNFGIIYTF